MRQNLSFTANYDAYDALRRFTVHYGALRCITTLTMHEPPPVTPAGADFCPKTPASAVLGRHPQGRDIRRSRDTTRGVAVTGSGFVGLVCFAVSALEITDQFREEHR